jgi:hypothetical protein
VIVEHAASNRTPLAAAGAVATQQAAPRTLRMQRTLVVVRLRCKGDRLELHVGQPCGGRAAAEELRRHWRSAHAGECRRLHELRRVRLTAQGALFQVEAEGALLVARWLVLLLLHLRRVSLLREVDAAYLGRSRRLCLRREHGSDVGQHLVSRAARPSRLDSQLTVLDKLTQFAHARRVGDLTAHQQPKCRGRRSRDDAHQPSGSMQHCTSFTVSPASDTSVARSTSRVHLLGFVIDTYVRRNLRTGSVCKLSPVCRLGDTLTQFADRVSVCKSNGF